MEYSEGDNEGRDGEVGDMPQVGTDECESCQFQGDSSVEYVETIRGS